MKKFLKFTAYGLFIFLASYNASAQNNRGPVSTPEVKATPVDPVLKSTEIKSMVPDNKESLKPNALPLQKSEAPKLDIPTAPGKPLTIEQKTFVAPPAAIKVVELKSVDRPNTSTLTGLKKSDPIQLPVNPPVNAPVKVKE